MSKKTVKLGLMPPLTGLVGIYGSEILHAAQVASQEVNESGGVLGQSLELIIEDDGSLPDSAVAAANKLVHEHHCSAIIGNLLSNSRIAVAYNVAEQNKIPLLNFSCYEGSILSHYFFHFAALPNQQIDKMIPYMANKFGQRVFFAGNNYEWPRGSIHAAKLALKNVEGKVVGEEYLPIGASMEEIDALLDEIEKANPDIFVPYFAGTDQINLLTRFTERGFKSRMAVVMGHYDEMMASQLSPEIREGFYSSNTYFMSIDSAENRNYLERLGRLPDVKGVWPNGNGILTSFGEGTYACVKAFAAAVNKAGSVDSELLVDALKTISVNSPQGIVQMNPEHHHAKVNTYLSQCNADGVFNIIENFGGLAAKIPDRYSHQRITSQATLEDDIRLQARMLEQMSEAIELVSMDDGSIIYTNAGADRMFGYEYGEMIGLPFFQINDSVNKDLRYESEEIVNVLSKKGEWKGDIHNLKKDGSVIWCSSTISSFTHPTYGEVWLVVQRDITELKKTETALRDSETLLKEAQRIAKMGAWELDIAKDKLNWSDETYRIFGVDKASFVNTYQAFLDTVHPDDAERVRKAFSNSLISRKPYEIEHRILLKNGSEKYVRDSCETIFSQEGKPLHSIGVVQDITERVGQEKALQESEERFKLSVAGSNDGIWDWDILNNTNYFSPRFITLLGFSIEDDFPQTMDNFSSKVHPDDLDRVMEAVRQHLEEHKPYDIEYRLKMKDGSFKWLLARGQAVWNDKGEAIRMAGSVSDISKRLKVQEDLSESELWMRSIYNSLDEAVLVVSADREITNVNEAALRIFGYSTEEILNSSTELFHVDNQHYIEFGKRINQSFDEDQSAHFEFEAKRKNGDIFPTEHTVSQLINSDGKTLGIVSVVRDISLRKQNEVELSKHRDHLEELVKEGSQEIIAAKVEAERANAAKSDFLSRMSHELRTPMNAILGFGQLLELNNKELSITQQKNVTEILDAGNHLLNLINEVLDLSRIESGNFEVDMEKVILDDVLKQCVSLIQPLAEARQLELHDKLSGNGYCIRADFTRLKQIMLNLLSNAVKYNCDSGSIILEGEVVNDHRLRISVTDTGKGLSDEDISRLYTPFDRLNIEENIEGTGIGLVITKHLVELMDGSIGVESTKETGCTFWVELALA